jgi:ribosomal protein S6E (S10)
MNGFAGFGGVPVPKKVFVLTETDDGFNGNRKG